MTLDVTFSQMLLLLVLVLQPLGLEDCSMNLSFEREMSASWSVWASLGRSNSIGRWDDCLFWGCTSLLWYNCHMLHNNCISLLYLPWDEDVTTFGACVSSGDLHMSSHRYIDMFDESLPGLSLLYWLLLRCGVQNSIWLVTPSANGISALGHATIDLTFSYAPMEYFL